MSMADDIEDFRAGLESAPLCAEIARLKEELAKAQAELAVWQSTFGTRQNHAEDVEKLKAENARLAAALKALYEHDADYITINHLGPVNHNQSMRDAFDALRGGENALRDLLGPTVELLKSMLEYQKRYRQPHLEDIRKELARLRAALEAKP